MTKGVYQLLIRLDHSATIQIGKLGKFDFPAGYYVYTGSAMGGLEARISRHLSTSKHFHWHIDYLLEHSSILRYASRESSTRLECECNRLTLRMPGARVPVAGFGSSDCKCTAHLVWLEEEPSQLPVEISGELRPNR